MAMKINRVQIKRFPIWVVVTFAIGLITGWGIFGVITKSIVFKSACFSFVFTLLFELFFKQKIKKDSSA